MSDAVELAFSSFGEGEPVVILHGLFGSARNWQTIAQRLAERWRVLTPDLRNHGASPWHSDATYPALAADLHRFVGEHAPDGSLVAGHSMGGKAAMALALLHPEQVRALAVMDIAPVTYAHGQGHLHYIEAMRALDLGTMGRRGDVDAALADAVPEAPIRQFLLKNLATDEGRMTWRINLEALSHQMDEIVGFPADLEQRQYSGSTLFLHGGASDYVRADHHRTIKQMFPAAVITAVEGAGHWLHAEQPAAVAKALTEFLGG